MLSCLAGAAASGLLPSAPIASNVPRSTSLPVPSMAASSEFGYQTPDQPKGIGPRRKAVERILNVELGRLTTALELQARSASSALALPNAPKEPTTQVLAKAPTTQEIAEEMENRQPIIRWALNLWIREAMGFDRFGTWCPALKKMGFFPQPPPIEQTQVYPGMLTPTPTLVQALRALRPSLEVEIRRGLRTRPLRVCRLAYRAILVYLLAALSFLPGPTQPLIQRTWPRIVEHLATTLETNHRIALDGIETVGVVYSTTTGNSAAALQRASAEARPRRQLGSRLGIERSLRWADGPLCSIQQWLSSRI